jgi:D-tyrosyl-tRNA(Tyr) deacylase
MNMLFFQSEEKLDEWLESNHAQRGVVLSIAKLWDLSQRWYHNRMSVDYHGRTIEEVQEIFKEVGLTSEFWQPG